MNNEQILLAALKRLLVAIETDYEKCPTMSVGTSYETNSGALDQAREAIKLAELPQPNALAMALMSASGALDKVRDQMSQHVRKPIDATGPQGGNEYGSGLGTVDNY